MSSQVPYPTFGGCGRQDIDEKRTEDCCYTFEDDIKNSPRKTDETSMVEAEYEEGRLYSRHDEDIMNKSKPEALNRSSIMDTLPNESISAI